jgi:DnaK suppressor protein
VDISVARKRLEQMRDELDRSITYLAGTEPLVRATPDLADAGSSLSENDRTEAILNSARGQREGVLAALARLEARRYGQCVDCGHDIPEGRLDALPDASRCVQCQAKYARRGRR